MKEGASGPSPSVLAAMAKAHLRTGNLTAARLLLRRAFAMPSSHEYDALVEYVEAMAGFDQWRQLTEDFELSARSVYELQQALFAAHEKAGRWKEALALLAAEPGLIRPVGEFRIDGAAAPPIDCQRVRKLVETGAGFPEVSEALKGMIASHIPDAAPELAALNAGRAEKMGNREEALRHLEQAAALRPTSWEFARRITETRLDAHELEKAKEALERFLSVSPVALEREAALDLWERANAGSPLKKAGS
jgi:tetratricopeptide (TPR) repeat protein